MSAWTLRNFAVYGISSAVLEQRFLHGFMYGLSVQNVHTSTSLYTIYFTEVFNMNRKSFKND
jgi:hypothetical protein